jgi:hypothetical protein
VHAFIMSLLVYLSTVRLLEFTSIYKPVGVLINTFVKMTIDVVRASPLAPSSGASSVAPASA